MKAKHITFIFILPFLFSACSLIDVTEVKDCICTTEFRVYSVTVVDSSGSPVDSLITTVKSSRGKIFKPYQEPSLPGKYWLMDDGYTNEFTTLPTIIIFTGIRDSIKAEAVYLFNTDDCKCHVQKLGGPDTIVAKY